MINRYAYSSSLACFGRLLSASAFALVALVAPSRAVAQNVATEYPNRPVTFIVQFAAGGTTDISARKLVALAEREFGQSFVVKNVTGATGNLGHNAIAKAEPDGYTIGTFAYSGTVIVPHLQPVPFDTRTDFSFIAQYTDLPQVLVVADNSPWKDLAQLVDWARQNPGAFTYGTTGVGSAQNLFMELLAKSAGVQFTHVPYRGDSSMAVLGGEIRGSLAAEGARLAQSGRVRALAVLGDQRLSGLPNVPTFTELGYNIPMPLWVGIVGPKGLPEPVRLKLERAFAKAYADPAFKQALDVIMLTPRYRTGEEFGRVVLKDYERGREVVQAAGQGVKP